MEVCGGGGTTVGSLVLYDKPPKSVDPERQGYHEGLLASHIRLLDPDKKGVAVICIVSTCHSGAFIDDNNNLQQCKEVNDWCHREDLGGNVAWITAANAGSSSSSLFDMFLLSYGWNKGWAFKGIAGGTASFFDLGEYAIGEYNPIAMTMGLSGGEHRGEQVLRNVMAGTAAAVADSSLSAPSKPVNLSATKNLADYVRVAWEQGSGGKPDWYCVIRRRKGTEEFENAIVTSQLSTNIVEIASQAHPMQYAVAAFNGAGVAVTDKFEDGWRTINVYRATFYYDFPKELPYSPTSSVSPYVEAGGSLSKELRLETEKLSALDTKGRPYEFTGWKRMNLQAVWLDYNGWHIPNDGVNEDLEYHAIWEIKYGYAKLTTSGNVLSNVDMNGATEVVVPDDVTRIGEYSFTSSAALEVVTIPESVESIGESAFAGCSNLTRVVFNGNAPTVGDNAFSGVADGCEAFVSRNSTGWGVDIPGKWNGVNIQYSTYFVSFISHVGDGFVTRREVATGAEIGELPVLTQAGYKFLGWFTEAEGGEQIEEGTTVDYDMTLYAQWEYVMAAPNPVTGETETYTYRYVGGGTWTVTDWNDENGDTPAAAPALPYNNIWDSLIINSQEISAPDPVEGWRLRLGLFNGAKLTIPTLNKWQGGCYVCVDATSQLTISKFGNRTFGDDINFYVAAPSGIVYGVDYAKSGNYNYHFAGEGSVSYKSLYGGSHTIRNADITLSGSAERMVNRKTLIYFRNQPNINVDATVKIKAGDGKEVGKVWLTEIVTEEPTITVDDAVGTCQFVKTETSIDLCWVDGDADDFVPPQYLPSISINFTEDDGSPLSTGMDVGFGAYAVPGTAWSARMVR